MSNPFFDRPILNSPYECPTRHWELDANGQPTQRILEVRRRAEFITPIPKPKKRKQTAKQDAFVFDEGKGLSTKEQQYDPTSIINEVRGHVDAWRSLPNSNDWHVSPETARLLQHWRHHKFSSLRPFFCQTEAVETAIWLTEVAPQLKSGKRLLDHLASANRDANPELMRLALKLATGSGKTTVMAMIIAWQTINAVRRPGSKNFTRGFLVCTPGLTIKDRLRVLQPNDPDSYYKDRELVPNDMLDDVNRAKIVITNYHAFKLRERIELSAGGRSLLQGRGGDDLNTQETDGQMLQRVMPDLMGMKNILAINDEAHHCYREKPKEADDEDLKGDERKEAEKNNEAARLWISGLEAVNRKLGLGRVIDLSATPFFLRGSGYAEGTLYPWTMCDFSLMDAIECGIVKLPRVPVAENIPGNEMPMFRNLWEHIRKDMPKKGRGQGGDLDPLKLPTRLQTALQELYGHYEKTFKLWEGKGIKAPPCFIIVCQNTAISKLVYDFISGFHRKNDDGTTTLENGRLALFRNFDEVTGNPLPRPNTILIDSEQLEAGDALDENFRGMAADEIERFRREIVERTGDARAGDKITDQELLREVMNTVGKPGQLGGAIRCVVSVSMLTEGWDANTVTHVLGIRAFGTQLLCEQVIGRALRRQSYDLNEEQLFNVEYADVFGVPFDFTAKPVVAPPQPPRETVQVRAVRPERDPLEICFPRVEGYRIELPEERLTANFNDESILELNPDLVGPSITHNSGIIGEGVNLSLEHLGDLRPSTLVFHITQRLLYTKWRDPGDEPKLHLFGQLKRITKQWLDTCLVCKGDTYPGLLMYQELADMACNKITAAITRQFLGERPIKALLDPYNPTGSTMHVRFNTSRADRWDTSGPPPKNHVNWVVLDSDWEAEFCRIAESHSKVMAYTKNHNLGLEVPYRYGSETRRYLPDFIVLINDHSPDDPLHLIVEIKGYRRENAKEKKSTMDTYWVPGVNHLGAYGRWAFAEFTEIYQMEADFKAKVESEFTKMIEKGSATMTRTLSPPDYAAFLAGLKERILQARTSAARAVNRDLILLYWDIGRGIVEKQRALGWGEAVVERLSADLRAEFPDMRGFSVVNLWRMKQFYLSHTSPEFLSQAVRDLKLVETGSEELVQPAREIQNIPRGTSDPEFLSQAVRELVAAIPWGHHVNLLTRVTDPAARIYYLRATAQLGWSRNVLLNQIKAGAYERAVKERKTHNFALALPEHFAEQANEMMKSRYNLEFLGIGRAVKERELENRLVDRLQQFLLELGYGFCFIGRQYRLSLGGKEYFVDLLFYHRRLKALIAFDLKVGSFEPEHAGKMDFYLNLLNDKERSPGDQPSIGIILCAEKDDVAVEYALKTKTNPIGVAEYQLLPRLPAKYKGRLPTARQLAGAVRDVIAPEK